MRFSELLTVELNSQSRRVESKVKVKRSKEATSPARAAEETKKGRILQLLTAAHAESDLPQHSALVC
jgi:hypothetical protein